MRGERLVDRRVAGGRAGGCLERPRVAAQAQRGAWLVEPRAGPEQRCARRPQRAVALGVLRAKLAAERDELGQIGHCVGFAERGDTHEAVGIQVVAEQQREIGIARRKQPRLAVVREVALVDRLEAEREPRLRERREHGDELSLVAWEQRVLPQRALRSGGVGYLVPHAAIVLSMSSSLCASETNIASNCDGAT